MWMTLIGWAAAAPPTVYVGVAVPATGVGYGDTGLEVAYDLVPLSLEVGLAHHWGARLAVDVGYHTGRDRRVWTGTTLRVEAPHYFGRTAPTQGFYLGPFASVSLRTGLPGLGVTLGYSGLLGETLRWRTGLWIGPQVGRAREGWTIYPYEGGVTLLEVGGFIPPLRR